MLPRHASVPYGLLQPCVERAPLKKHATVRTGALSAAQRLETAKGALEGHRPGLFDGHNMVKVQAGRANLNLEEQDVGLPPVVLHAPTSCPAAQLPNCCCCCCCCCCFLCARMPWLSGCLTPWLFVPSCLASRLPAACPNPSRAG
jgi:hypothetical protein